MRTRKGASWPHYAHEPLFPFPRDRCMYLLLAPSLITWHRRPVSHRGPVNLCDPPVTCFQMDTTLVAGAVSVFLTCLLLSHWPSQVCSSREAS